MGIRRIATLDSAAHITASGVRQLFPPGFRYRSVFKMGGDVETSNSYRNRAMAAIVYKANDNMFGLFCVHNSIARFTNLSMTTIGAGIMSDNSYACAKVAYQGTSIRLHCASVLTSSWVKAIISGRIVRNGVISTPNRNVASSHRYG